MIQHNGQPNLIDNPWSTNCLIHNSLSYNYAPVHEPYQSNLLDRYAYAGRFQGVFSGAIVC